MKTRRAMIQSLILVLMGFGFAPAAVHAITSADALETGRLLAILLDAGRATVGANQTLINDRDKGDKGFTPEVFEKQLTARAVSAATENRPASGTSRATDGTAIRKAITAGPSASSCC
jgi:hypothetical protein